MNGLRGNIILIILPKVWPLLLKMRFPIGWKLMFN